MVLQSGADAAFSKTKRFGSAIGSATGPAIRGDHVVPPSVDRAAISFVGPTTCKGRKEWAAARTLYQNSLDMLVDMRNKNLLVKMDADKPNEIARQIARCDAALAAE
jgi:hypothetical protein